MDYSHDYLVETITGDQYRIPVNKGDDTDLEVARALASRLTPTGVMWGPSANEDDDHDTHWIVIPSAAISAVTIRRRPVLTPTPTPAVDVYDALPTYDPGAASSPAPVPVTDTAVG